MRQLIDRGTSKEDKQSVSRSLLDETPPPFEAGLWATGDQHNGHCAHCWFIVHLELNDRSPVSLIRD